MEAGPLAQAPFLSDILGAWREPYINKHGGNCVPVEGRAGTLEEVNQKKGQTERQTLGRGLLADSARHLTQPSQRGPFPSCPLLQGLHHACNGGAWLPRTMNLKIHALICAEIKARNAGIKLQGNLISSKGAGKRAFSKREYSAVVRAASMWRIMWRRAACWADGIWDLSLLQLT